MTDKTSIEKAREELRHSWELSQHMNVYVKNCLGVYKPEYVIDLENQVMLLKGIAKESRENTLKEVMEKIGCYTFITPEKVQEIISEMIGGK